MNKADSLVAAFRQLATAKTLPRAGSQHAAIAKEGKDKAEHFRDQLKQLEQATKRGPHVAAENVKSDGSQALEQSIQAAEPAEQAGTRPKGKREHSTEAVNQAETEAVSSPIDWRGPAVTLSAVVSKLDQAQVSAAQGDVVNMRGGHSSAHAAGDPSLEPDLDLELSIAKDQPEQRFTVAVEADDTRIAPTVKVAVREQETHFEPVQQVSTLQKIVDRMATDLSATAAPAGPNVAEAAQADLQRAADKPLRMLTIQLDPPDLGAVTVRMRLAGDAVEVRLTADNYDTTQLLQKERSALSDAMRTAGYSFDITSIDHSHAADANPNQGQQQGQPDQRQSQPSQAGSHFDPGASGRSPSDAQGGARHNRQGNDQFAESTERKPEKSAVRTGPGSAVYL